MAKVKAVVQAVVEATSAFLTWAQVPRAKVATLRAMHPGCKGGGYPAVILNSLPDIIRLVVTGKVAQAGSVSCSRPGFEFGPGPNAAFGQAYPDLLKAAQAMRLALAEGDFGKAQAAGIRYLGHLEAAFHADPELRKWAVALGLIQEAPVKAPAKGKVKKA